MAKSLKLDEKKLAKYVKEFNAVSEIIRSRQDEKQSVMDDYDAERKRYRSGRISEKTLISSKVKTNKELMRLDKNIRDAISKSRSIGETMKNLISRQAPKTLRATESGVKLRTSGSKKKKKISRKKAPDKKKPAKKKAPAKKKSKGK